MVRWYYAALIALAALAAGAPSDAQIAWTAPTYVNQDGSYDGALVFDSNPQLATDGEGTVVVVWERIDLSELNLTRRIYVTRSTNNGRTSTKPSLLYTPAVVGDDMNPHIATDGKGKWVVVWESTRNLLGDSAEGDIYFAKSLDNGKTWLGPFAVNNVDGDGPVVDHNPVIGTTSDGTWVTAWQSSRTAGEAEISIARYQDANGFWEAPVTRSAGKLNAAARLANDGANTWMVTWEVADDSLGQHDVAVVVSENDGATWTDESVVNPDSIVSGETNRSPILTTDRRGVWLVVWMRELADGTDMDPYFVYSVDNGAVWNGPIPVGGAPDAKAGTAYTPLVATDGMGNWLTVWETTEKWDGGSDDDVDIMYSVSSSGGVQWTPPTAMNQNAATDTGTNDEGAALIADEHGNWICVWSYSFDPASSESGEKDTDILGTVGYFTGYLTGRVVDATTLEPVVGAAVFARKPDGAAARLEMTDQNGYYRFDRLPAGGYSVTAIPADVNGLSGRNRATVDGVVVRPGEVTKQTLAVEGTALNGAVYGTVLGETIPGDSDSRVPLVGVQVTAFVNGSGEPAASTFTDADGRYVFNDLAAKGATDTDVTVQFDAAGFESDNATTTVAPGETAEQPATLSPKSISFAATLAGLVCESGNQAPISGAQVVLRGPVNLSKTTGANGVYLFDALPSGTYTITTSKSGFAASTATMGVTAKGTVVNHNVQLDSAYAANAIDVNHDGVVNASDVQLVVNAVLGTNLGGFDADVNQDNEINVIDVQLVVNVALGV